MIDTHAHLDFKDFDEDREEVISRAFDNGVKAMVNIGVDLATSRKSIKLAEKHEHIFASVGLHPHEFNDQTSKNNDQRDWIGELKRLAKNKKVVAIGEIGLDYFSHTDEIINDEQKENQKKGFLAQIEIAKELELPVIVHCREAWEDLYEIISSFLRLNLKNRSLTLVSSKVRPFPSPTIRRGIPQGQTFFVLHCYSGEKKDTEKFLELPNVYFSFSGNITYPSRRISHPSVLPQAGHLPSGRGGNLAEAVKMIPLEQMMLDSDSPFLAPQQARGKRNEPSYVRYIAKKIAEIKEISLEKVEKTTDENANEFFGLD